MTARRRLGAFLFLGSLLGAFALVYFEGRAVSAEDTVAWLAALAERPATPWVVYATVLFGGIVVFPVAPAVLFAGAVYGLSGFPIVLAGMLSACVVGYLIGNRLGAEWAQQSPKASVMAARIAKHGALASMLSRWIPGVPFALQNLLLGAAGVPFVTFFLGSIVGASVVGLIFLAGGAAGAEMLTRLEDAMRFGWIAPAAGVAAGGFLLWPRPDGPAGRS